MFSDVNKSNIMIHASYMINADYKSAKNLKIKKLVFDWLEADKL